MVFLPRMMRSRVIRQTCATPDQSGFRYSASAEVVSRRRVSIRPWLFSIVSAARRSVGGDHVAEGGKGPEGLSDIRFQRGLVSFDGEEVIPAPVDDDLANRALREHRVAGDGDAFQRQCLQKLQRRGDFIGIGGDP